jgi:hypothetical protein
VSAAADDQVVVDGRAERLGGLDDVSDGDVRRGRGRVARGWLCTKINAEAWSSSARLTTSPG